MFSGFPEETIRFFLDLAAHNEASFFKSHQDEYLSYVRQPFYQLIAELAPTARQVIPDAETRPDKCLCRIHRDTRFSKDKSPYRDHMWFLLRRSGEAREPSIMYWRALSPCGMGGGLGTWGPNRPMMDVLRRRIAEHPRQVQSVLKQCALPDATKGLQMQGERYQRMKVPDGVPKALGQLYTCKSLYIQRVDAPLRDAYSPELAQKIKADILRLGPMYHWMRSAADEAMAQLDG